MRREPYVDFIERHINELKNELSKIYTIKAPEGLRIAAGTEINISEELTWLREAEDIYSVIENGGESNSEIYERYNDYLKKVRESISVAEKEIKKIENEYQADINNIMLLLKRFEEKRETL